MIGKSMTEGAPWKHIIRFSLPVLFGSLLQQLYNTVDTIIVGNFSGEEALSAVGTTSTLTFFFLAIAIGLSSGNGVLIAQHYGAGNEKNVRRCASAGILFLLAMGAVITIISIALSRPAFKNLLAVPDEILDQTIRYFVIYALGFIFQYGYNIFSSILRAIGDSAATLYFLMISSFINVVLDLLFVAVFNWGVSGAAIATVIAQLISFCAAYLYMRRKYPIFRFALREYRWNADAVGKTVKIGLPISLQLSIVSMGLTMIMRAVNEFGRIMTASYTVGSRIEQYINLPFNALQTTMATYTGQNIGANKYDRVRKGAIQCCIVSLSATIVISALIMLFAVQLAHLFGLSEDALVYCVPHIRTVALVNIILSFYAPLHGLFQGAGHSGLPMIVSIFALSTRVAVVYLFRYTAFFGESILWWNGLFGFGLAMIITWAFYLTGKWDNSRSLKNSVA